MKITKEFLSQCTDEQINKGVAWLQIKSFRLTSNYGIRDSLDMHAARIMLMIPYNYCTNPNDIMPIAFANNISITTKPDEHIGKPFAFSTGVLGRTVHCDSNDELLRAICEVYILMGNS